jgi:hypothetical protein
LYLTPTGASADLRGLTGAADLRRAGVELALRGSRGKVRKPALQELHARAGVPQLPADGVLVPGRVARFADLGELVGGEHRLL